MLQEKRAAMGRPFRLVDQAGRESVGAMSQVSMNKFHEKG
jgi:hypothetical protein